MIVQRQSSRFSVSRRGLLAGALAGGGLWVGWKFWPRADKPELLAAIGETVLNGFIKIGDDGHITLVTPQVEMGQGSHTLLAQIVADELGADWRTMAIEPAPIHDHYANVLLARQWDVKGWGQPALQATGGSTSISEFAPRLRDAAAGARILLSMAAAEQWDADWQACETDQGFVTRGKDRLRFGALAKRAGELRLPDQLTYRAGGNRLWGAGVDRLDVPAKLDGSANFAGDVRLPDMVFAAISMGPTTATKLTGYDRAAGEKLPGFVDSVATETWLAVVGTSWWAAKQALIAMKPRYGVSNAPTSVETKRIMAAAFKADGHSVAAVGDAAALMEGIKPVEADYEMGFAFHGALEPMSATAAISDGRMDLWITTQQPRAARDAAARATGLAADRIAVHAMQLGGSFGRKHEVEIAAQVTLIAQKIGRPVQLNWSRAEDMAQDRPRPAAHIKWRARLEGGRIAAMEAQIATADGTSAMLARTLKGASVKESALMDGSANPALATEGLQFPYSVPALSISHHPVAFGVATGRLRSGAHGISVFARESFVDELARLARQDGFSFRMAMLAENARLAQCLAKVAARGGWEGGQQGSGQGFACHMQNGGFIAVLAEASLGPDRRPVVTKLVAVVDAGRILNPDLARQQVEGGLLHGLALAVAEPIGYQNGVPSPNHFAAHGWSKCSTMPEISVELIRSDAELDSVNELALPAVAPAIANAIHGGSGVRLRALPLSGVSA